MSHKFNNLFLIGPMGSGKNAVGKCIAELANLDFFDSDQEVERRTGVSISWIFEQEGEAGFRRREQKAIADLVLKNPIILATGGGAITTAANCQTLSNNGTVVLLEVSLEVQLQRLSKQKAKRPLFIDPTQLAQLNTARADLYHAIADLCYSTDTITPAALAKIILQDWQQLQSTARST